MALIADEVCKIGFVIAALPGTRVSREAADRYGWKVHDDGRTPADAPADAPAGDAGQPAAPAQ